MAPLLRVSNLRTSFFTSDGEVRAVDGVTFDIGDGKTVGLVGESGCGKSVTALSIVQLLPMGTGRIVGGEIQFQARNLASLPEQEIRRIRGNEISMIFQEPMTSLNPVMTVGDQIAETVRLHQGASRSEARNRAIEMLRLVKIADPQKRVGNYPHQFSGGQRQRVMIAMALALNPGLLIADEPTTALDVTIQAQILDLMLELKGHQKDSAILLITHNLAVVAETCDRVAVMYGGKIQELAPVKELVRNPMHPYTRGLLGSLPRVDGNKAERLTTIPGSVPDILDLPAGCKFTTRCPDRFEPCPDIEPALIERAPGHFVRCHLYGITNEK